MRIRFEQELKTTRLGAALREARGTRTVRAAAEEAQIPPATFSALEHGRVPDLVTFYKACFWLRIPTRKWPDFMDMDKV